MGETLEEQGLKDKPPEECSLPELLTIRDASHDHPSHNVQLWYRKYEKELIRRVRKLSESRALETAIFELQALIDETDDPTDGEEGSMTPLARARLRIEERAENAFHPAAAKGYQGAIDVINEVAEETGADPTPNDPLTSDNFEHLQLLEAIYHGYDLEDSDPLA